MENTVNYLLCPYDNSHRISKQRFPYHLRKCVLNHPNSRKVSCPNNALHIVDKDKLKDHLEECSSKNDIIPYEPTEDDDPVESGTTGWGAPSDDWVDNTRQTYFAAENVAKNTAVESTSKLATAQSKANYMKGRRQDNQRFQNSTQAGSMISNRKTFNQAHSSHKNLPISKNSTRNVDHKEYKSSTTLQEPSKGNAATCLMKEDTENVNKTLFTELDEGQDSIQNLVVSTQTLNIKTEHQVDEAKSPNKEIETWQVVKKKNPRKNFKF